MHTNIEVAEVLEDSAERVFAHGLAKGIIGTPGGTQCTVGYLNTSAWERLGFTLPSRIHTFFFPRPVGIDRDVQRSVTAIVDDAVKAVNCVIDDPRVITTWSDDVLTTPEIVREAFLLAAKDVRNNA